MRPHERNNTRPIQRLNMMRSNNRNQRNHLNSDLNPNDNASSASNACFESDDQNLDVVNYYTENNSRVGSMIASSIPSVNSSVIQSSESE